MAHTSGTQYATEFSGQYKTVTVLVDGGTETSTLTITGISTIRGAQVTLAEAPTANASLVRVNHNGASVCTVMEYTPQGTLCTQTAIDFYLTVIGEY